MAKVETGCEAILRRIAEQEARIVRQKRLIEGLAANGTISANARGLLQVMEATLGTLHASLAYFSNHR